MSTNLTLNIEKIKNQKDGLDVLSDIYIHAVLGERVSEENLIRFQWYGIYQQENSNKYFTLSIPLELGQLTVEQLKTLSFISKEYAKDSLNIKEGQKIELRNLRLHELPHIFNLLHNVDLHTTFEAGHTVRNIITCPINTVDCKQLIDVSELATKLNESFIGNKNFSNLPNKLEFSISGCKEGCAFEEAVDVSFDANKNEAGKILFAIKIKGEHIGFITPSQILTASKSIAKIYRDYGNREDYSKSSFSSFITSWGLNEFANFLNSTINFKIKDILLAPQGERTKGEHFGINKSTIEGQSYIGFKMKNLNISANKINNFTKILEDNGASKIKFTNQGNIIILDVPNKQAENLAQKLKSIEFDPFS